MHPKIFLSLSLSIALAVATLAATPANAAASANEIEQISALLAESSPDGASIVVGDTNAQGLVIETPEVATTIPFSNTGEILVSAVAENEVISAKLPLPPELNLKGVSTAADGTAIYGSSDGGASLAVQVLEDGSTRIHTIIPDEAAQHEFSYSIDGYLPALSTEGDAMFIGQGANSAVVPVEPAWATDANGVAVETRYEVRGHALVQVVIASSDTLYPIVADPTLRWHYSSYGFSLTRSETAAIKDYAAAVGMCVAISKRAPNMAIACAAWGSYLLLQATTANKLSPKGCLHIGIVPAPGAVYHMSCSW